MAYAAAGIPPAGVQVQVSLQAPAAPRMRVLLPKRELKALIVKGMDLLMQRLLEARMAKDASAGPAAVAQS